MQCYKCNLTNAIWQMQSDKCNVTNAMWQIQCDKWIVTNAIIINFFKRIQQLLLIAQKLPTKNLFSRSHLEKIPLRCGAYRWSPIVINFFKQIPQLLLVTQKLPTKNLLRRSRPKAGIFQLEKNPLGVWCLQMKPNCHQLL